MPHLLQSSVYDSLKKTFQKNNLSKLERIGLEIELGVVDQNSGLSLSYVGKPGVRDLLINFMSRESQACKPILENDLLLGYQRQDGVKITLEHNGSVEYSSCPEINLTELITKTNTDLVSLANIAKEKGIILLTAGNTPFDCPKNINWLSKSRTQVMLEYLKLMGGFKNKAWRVFGQGLATQVNFDYFSEEDMSLKITALAPIAPILSAIFCNSPIQDGVQNGFLSNRQASWLDFDPHHAGCLMSVFSNEITIESHINRLLEIPTIFSIREQLHHPFFNKNIYELLSHKDHKIDSNFILDNWNVHLSSIFHDIRLRELIEIRCIDGQTFRNLPAVPTLITGLIYHNSSLYALRDIFSDFSIGDYHKAFHSVCLHGLKGRYGKFSIHELAEEILDLAKNGLKERIRLGLENSSVFSYLEGAEEVIQSGITLAERNIYYWNNEWNRDANNLVKYHQIIS